METKDDRREFIQEILKDRSEKVWKLWKLELRAFRTTHEVIKLLLSKGFDISYQVYVSKHFVIKL